MKHYILTRFASWDYLGNGQIFTKEYLENSFNKLQLALLNTLKNQTTNNFTLIINIHDNIEKYKIQFLHNINEKFNIKILRTSEISNFIKNDSQNEKLVIMSRIDIDDFLLNDIIERVQFEISKCETDYIFCGLYNGATFTYNDKDVYFFPTPPYIKNNSGAFSVFMTIACNNNKCKKYIDITLNKGLKTPLAYDHTQVFTFAKNLLETNDTYTTFYIKNNEDEPLYLWTGYGNNGTTLKKIKNKSESIKWHKSSIKLDIDFKKYMAIL